MICRSFRHDRLSELPHALHACRGPCGRARLPHHSGRSRLRAAPAGGDELHLPLSGCLRGVGIHPRRRRDDALAVSDDDGLRPHDRRALRRWEALWSAHRPAGRGGLCRNHSQHAAPDPALHRSSSDSPASDCGSMRPPPPSSASRSILEPTPPRSSGRASRPCRAHRSRPARRSACRARRSFAMSSCFRRSG